MTDADQLRAQIPSSTDPDRLRRLALEAERRDGGVSETTALVEFARWVIRETCFEGKDLDPGDVQDKGVELGLLVAIEGGWDPEKHDSEHWSHDFMEPGDPYFELAPLLTGATPGKAPGR